MGRRMKVDVSITRYTLLQAYYALDLRSLQSDEEGDSDLAEKCRRAAAEVKAALAEAPVPYVGEL